MGKFIATFLMIFTVCFSVGCEEKAGTISVRPVSRIQVRNEVYVNVDKKAIVLENGKVRMEFDRGTGALVSLVNLSTNDDYIKDKGGEGNPFRVYVDTTEMPAAATVLFPWPTQPVEGALGGKLADPKNCVLKSYSVDKIAGGKKLTLVMSHTETGMEFTLQVNMTGDVAIDCFLTARNTDKTAHKVMAAIPYFTGLGLGSDRSSNLGVTTAGLGTAGVPAWVNTGGAYGNKVSMQWQAVYEPKLNEGFGVIAMDNKPLNKIIRRFPEGGISVLYFDNQNFEPGASYSYPGTRLIVHEGNWRIAAKRYAKWHESAFKIRPVPKWMNEIDMFLGWWIPNPRGNAQFGQPVISDAPGDFSSFRNLDRLYLDDYYDIQEWAFYWQGVEDNDGVKEGWGSDGTYYMRSDIGGVPAMREGVEKVHKLGRRVLYYVSIISVRDESDIFKGTNIDDWKLMDKPGHMLDIGYPKGVSMCMGYKPWREHLAQVCKRLIWETGADGVRLDEFGSTFIPCFNPAHKHESPYDCHKWCLEFLKTIRTAMDEVNPNSLMFTEGPIDYTEEYTTGALQMFESNGDLEPIRLATPNAKIIGYCHPGSIEAALNGWPSGRMVSRRCYWPGGDPDWHGKPKDYPEGLGAVSRWHELRASFRDAWDLDAPTDVDPVIKGNTKWVGRLWTTDDYWVMTGANYDGTPLGGQAQVLLPELPKEITRAYEFDAYDLSMREIPLERKEGKVYVTVQSDFAAVLLPKPDCQPIVEINADCGILNAGQRLDFEDQYHLKQIGISGTYPNAVQRGGSVKVKLSGFSPWSSKKEDVMVNVESPGLKVSGSNVKLPAEVTIDVPQDAEPGNYYLRVTGDCMELKRWIRVK